MNQSENLRSLLESVATGNVSPDVALDKLKHFAYEPVGEFARIDHHRTLRTGFPEVIWGLGKTPDQIAQIIEVMRDRSSVVMATRIEPQVYTQLKEKVSDLQYYPMARICALQSNKQEVGTGSTDIPMVEQTSLKNPLQQPNPPQNKTGIIGILCAGTADLPVAEEAAVTAELAGFRVQRLWDVGVAGIHRLLDNRHVIDSASVLIVVAGMEGALPSVVAGLADCPVIAVPTSIGYGANFNGLAPLLTMLNSCAAGVGVVNIDNGFGAAILAGQILRMADKLQVRSLE